MYERYESLRCEGCVLGRAGDEEAQGQQCSRLTIWVGAIADCGEEGIVASVAHDALDKDLHSGRTDIVGGAVEEVTKC